MTKILDGKNCAYTLLEELRLYTRSEKQSPTLVIYSIGDNEASRVYIKNKIKAADQVGINTIVRNYGADVEQNIVYDQLWQDAANDTIHGIIIQLPLPLGWDSTALIEIIPSVKDVDGLKYENAGRLWIDETNCHDPCTARGILWLLHENHIHLYGKHVVIVGRSPIVGKPMAMLALSHNATVTICHSYTKNLAEYTKTADILIVATGIPKLITADMVKPGAVVVDVGINRDQDNKLCGDVDFDNVSLVAGAITPVPGGVGPMTVAVLMHNTIYAMKMINKEREN